MIFISKLSVKDFILIIVARFLLNIYEKIQSDVISMQDYSQKLNLEYKVSIQYKALIMSILLSSLILKLKFTDILIMIIVYIIKTRIILSSQQQKMDDLIDLQSCGITGPDMSNFSWIMVNRFTKTLRYVSSESHVKDVITTVNIINRSTIQQLKTLIFIHMMLINYEGSYCQQIQDVISDVVNKILGKAAPSNPEQFHMIAKQKQKQTAKLKLKQEQKQKMKEKQNEKSKSIKINKFRESSVQKFKRAASWAKSIFIKPQLKLKQQKPQQKHQKFQFNQQKKSNRANITAIDDGLMAHRDKLQSINLVQQNRLSAEDQKMLNQILIAPYCWFVIKSLTARKELQHYHNEQPYKQTDYQSFWKVIQLFKSLFAASKNLNKFIQVLDNQFLDLVTVIIKAFHADISVFYPTTIKKIIHKIQQIFPEVMVIEKKLIPQKKKLQQLEQIQKKYQIVQFCQILDEISNLASQIQQIYCGRFLYQIIDDNCLNMPRLYFEFPKASLIYDAVNFIKKSKTSSPKRNPLWFKQSSNATSAYCLENPETCQTQKQVRIPKNTNIQRIKNVEMVINRKI